MLSPRRQAHLGLFGACLLLGASFAALIVRSGGVAPSALKPERIRTHAAWLEDAFRFAKR
jgi:hypothetical protein